MSQSVQSQSWSTSPLVVGVFEDEVRAEQAARALEVWRSANGSLGLGAIGVVARRLSGSTTWRIRGVIRPGAGALRGLIVGLLLFALPAAGAAGFAAWLFGSIVFNLAGLVGAVPAGQVGNLVLALILGAAILAGVLVGLIGALIGCLVGLLVGVISEQVRGLTRTEVATTAASLRPGAWAAVARVQVPAEPLVRDELVRLGAAPVVEQVTPPPLPPAAETPAEPPASPPADAAPRGPSEEPVPAGSRKL